MHIYIGNLPPETTDEELKSMFSEFGEVRSATIGLNKKTGASEGYGLVEMPVKSEARAAVEGLRGKDVQGKPLRVRILKPDDPFHNAIKGQQGMKGGARPQGTTPFRGTGMVRRGGQRGS